MAAPQLFHIETGVAHVSTSVVIVMAEAPVVEIPRPVYPVIYVTVDIPLVVSRIIYDDLTWRGPPSCYCPDSLSIGVH